MTVKKTQYTKQELVELAKKQTFGLGSLSNSEGQCVLGWLLSLSGVHESRMVGMRIYPPVGDYLRCFEILGISSIISTDIYLENDRSGPFNRTSNVVGILKEALPDDYVLSGCDENLKGAMV